MTVGVLWEFFEYGMDVIFLTDMQKDTILHSMATVQLRGDGTVEVLRDISAVTVNGRELGLGGYLDIGLHDTMADLLVNFVGAVVFSVLGYFHIRRRGKGRGGRLMTWLLPSIAEETETDAGAPKNEENIG
jgi:hypothetical protein